jgi:hypothetical protein
MSYFVKKFFTLLFIKKWGVFDKIMSLCEHEHSLASSGTVVVFWRAQHRSSIFSSFCGYIFLWAVTRMQTPCEMSYINVNVVDWVVAGVLTL